MRNNDTLKEVAKRTKDLKHLSLKKDLTYSEYMQLVYTNEWQQKIRQLTK